MTETELDPEAEPRARAARERSEQEREVQGEAVARAAREPVSHEDGEQEREATGDATEGPVNPRALDEEQAELLSQLDVVTAERDDYLDQLQRQRAEFQNYRKRVEAERRQQVSAGVSRLVESLLPVLDGCDAATSQGHGEVAAVGQSLMVALGKAGLERIDSVGEPFDPTQHEAVTIEEAVDDAPQIVAAELRSGFRFDGRVLRAAMVKVRTG